MPHVGQYTLQILSGVGAVSAQRTTLSKHFRYEFSAASQRDLKVCRHPSARAENLRPLVRPSRRFGSSKSPSKWCIENDFAPGLGGYRYSRFVATRDHTNLYIIFMIAQRARLSLVHLGAGGADMRAMLVDKLRWSAYSKSVPHQHDVIPPPSAEMNG